MGETNISVVGITEVTVNSGGQVPRERLAERETTTVASERDSGPEIIVDSESLREAGSKLEGVVRAVSGTDLSFSVEEDLSRMVVTVKAVGSDEIIRQFPPEEFLTVAKFIASKDLSEIDEDFLKGVLFDQYS